MIACVALLCALATSTGETLGDATIFQVNDQTSGGNGGRGGSAESKVVIECKVAGACPIEHKAIGGNGGPGGSAYGGARPAPSPGPVVARDEEPPIRSTISRCSLEIGGKTEIAARDCAFALSPLSKKTSVSAPSTNRKYRYTVTWLPRGDGTAAAFIEGGTTRAVRELGTLISKGACWVKGDDTVKVCAWK